MFDYTFVDLDHTIYDTDRLVEDMWNIASKRGVDPEDYKKTFYKSLHTVNEDQYDYGFEEHLNFLAELGYEIKDDFLEELKSLTVKNYLFPESIEFVNFLKTISKNTILLTAGNKKFQISKVNGCGVGKIFDRVVVSEISKVDFFRQNFFNKAVNSLFINDNLKENCDLKKEFPDLLVIGKLNIKKYSEIEILESGLPFFKTLKEIQNYVKKIR